MLAPPIDANPQHEPVEVENDPPAHAPSQPPPSPRVVISEIRPPSDTPSNSKCLRVLFDSSVAVRHAVPPLDGTTFRSSQLDQLCGIAIKPVVATDRLTVEGDLEPASVLRTVEGGETTYLLRANRPQNIVYQIQVTGETESGQPRTDVIRHAIVR
jgi:hypothetical protein